MGADQIGYLVKGPAEIPETSIRAAVRACRRLRKELLDEAGPDANEEERVDAALSRTGEFFDPEDIPEDPEPIIREFVDWWRAQDSRDTCSRQDPDNPKQLLVFAGEMSWGDEPDGRGYKMLRQAFAWGFAGALGIR